MSKIIVIDTSGLFFPAVFSWERQIIQKNESNSDRFIMPAHAVYFNSLLSCLKKIGVNKDDIVILATEGKSWRKGIAGYYKAQRTDDREKHKLIDWDKQFNYLNKINDALNNATNWHLIREWSSEADDILAVACRFYKDKDVILVTGDKDLHQLAYYSNVYIFNINKKCKNSKGMYEKVDKPLKIIADKVRLGDASDNIFVDKLNDTENDAWLRHKIINLLELPEEIEKAIVDILENLSEKELDLDKLPNFKNVQEKFLKIYDKEKIITPEYCYKLLEKRETKKKKKASEKAKLKREQMKRRNK